MKYAWFTLLFTVLFTILGVGAFVVSYDYLECRKVGNAYGVATRYSPVNGCTAYVLGTEVRVF